MPAIAAPVAAVAAGAYLWRVPRARRLLRRYATVGGVVGRTGMRRVVQAARSIGTDDVERRVLEEEFQLRSAEDVARTLGAMKGAFMKVGQLASFVDDAIPEPIREALAQLQDSA